MFWDNIPIPITSLAIVKEFHYKDVYKKSVFPLKGVYIMYPYNKILVSLDMSDKDDAVIRFTKLFEQHVSCRDIFFIHVTPPHELPAELREKYPELEEPTTENLRGTIKSKVQGVITACHDEEPMYYIRDGHPVEVILKTVKHDDIDLIIIGRKAYSTEHVTVSSLLARKTPCSVLVVPKGSEPRLNKILVPVDFSENSKLALNTALQISTSFDPRIPVLIFHVYKIPTGYGKTGKTRDEFGQIMRRNAEEQYEGFMEEIETADIPVEPHFALSENIDEAILDKAHGDNCDLIVVGARGRSATAAMLLGSLTEKLIGKTRLPLLAVKKKSENMGLLDALLNM
jgi:nucleotide-binding universal stress UspA family protein